jgi:predicted secreted Zn-dependent protease
MKKIFIFFLPLVIAGAGFSADNGTDIARLNNSDHSPQVKTTLPPVVTEKDEYYEVRGNSEDELRSEMCRCGCRWKDGKTYDSETSWHIRWDYDYERVPHACSAKAFQATVDLISRFPKWMRTDDDPQQLTAKWKSYMKSLVAHEKGHRDMAIRAVTELTRAVAELPSAPDCAELDRKVQSLCHDRLNKLDADANEYDAATRHGILQGAFFP